MELATTNLNSTKAFHLSLSVKRRTRSTTIGINLPRAEGKAGADGWQIVRVLERTAAGTTPFEDVQEAIFEKLKKESSPSNAGELLDKLYADAVIETDYDYVGKKPPKAVAE